MVADKQTFKFAAEGVEGGQRIRKGVEEVGKMINDAYTNIMTRTLNDVIKSRYEFLKGKLDKLGFDTNQYKIPKKLQVAKSKDNVKKQIDFEIQQLEQIFLDKMDY